MLNTHPSGRSFLSLGGVRELQIGLLLLALLAIPALLPTPQEPSAQVDSASSRDRPPGTRLLEVQLSEGRIRLADDVRITGASARIQRREMVEVVSTDEILNLRDGAIADTRTFYLGTDSLGRDILSRLMGGARISLSIALLAMLLAFTLGLTVGSLAAIGPRWLDELLMRTVDALLAFPQLFLIIALAALFRPNTWWIILLLGGTSWMTLTRLARAEIVSLQKQEFVLASRSIGLHPLAVLTRHLLPNALTPLIVSSALLVGNLILAEAALSFFGFGVRPPTPSWGNMVRNSYDSLGSTWWAALFPGIAIALTVIAFNLVGDGLRDRLDPKRRSSSPSAPLPEPASVSDPDLARRPW
ncbi:MAG: ABC transporter permease [Acidobacteriota bacterium]|nr:ABC transporter permease [Acidobacteriota bacterium]